MKKEEKIYGFFYNPMIEESAYMTISLHRTENGAKKAMKLHKAEKRKEWDKHDKWQQKEYGNEYKILKGSKFGRWEDWYVREVKIENN